VRWVAAAVVAVGLAAGCGSGVDAGRLGDALDEAEPAVAPFEGLTAIEVRVGDAILPVVVADSSDEHGAGLRDRTDPAPYAGMLFVFDDDSASRFTMRGVEEPLDLAFYAADGSQVGGHEMEPCPDDGDCPPYASDVLYRYALETPAGQLPDGALEPVTDPR